MKLTKWRRRGRLSWRIEFTWQDMWCGLFVQRPKLSGGIDFYLCIIPMLPIHIGWSRTVEATDDGLYVYTYHYLDEDGHEVIWGHEDDEVVDARLTKQTSDEW